MIRELVERDGIAAVALAGYSLGGNLALKLAGELSSTAAGVSLQGRLRGVADDGPGRVRGRAGTAVQRGVPVELRAESQVEDATESCGIPGYVSLDALGRIWTVRAFDEAYTAPHHGFHDAADYYYRASALRVIDRIQVPTLIVTSEDDPFVPIAPFRRPDSHRQSIPHRSGHETRWPLRLSRATL